MSITHTMVDAFLTKYFKENLNPDIRLGQAFCNHFNITNPELFYCTDTNRAWKLIEGLAVPDQVLTQSESDKDSW